MMTELVETPVEIVAGKARVPTGPGLGIVLNEDALSRYEVGC
jgi:L-alanine-DL-glutamate epimerase-like enolase superfamily enzyme